VVVLYVCTRMKLLVVMLIITPPGAWYWIPLPFGVCDVIVVCDATSAHSMHKINYYSF